MVLVAVILLGLTVLVVAAYYVDRQAVSYMTGPRREPGGDWWGGELGPDGKTPGFAFLGRSTKLQDQPGFRLTSTWQVGRDIGLKPGDQVVRVGGVSYSSNRAMARHLIRTREAGETIAVEVRRSGQHHTFQLRLQPFLRSPADLNLPFVEVEIRSQSGFLLKGWFIPPPQRSDGRAGVFVHGAKSSRFQGLEGARYWYDRGYGLLTMDLSGRGSSEGQYITYSVNERLDVASMVSWLRTHKGVAPEKVVVFGTSNGAASAIYAAAADPLLKALVVDAPYADLWTVASEELETRGLPKFLLYLLSLAVRLRTGIDLTTVRPAQVVDKVPGAILFVHGDADTQVFPYHSEQMVEARKAAGLPTEFWMLPGGQHDFDNYPPPEVFWPRVFDFYDSVLMPTQVSPRPPNRVGMK